MMSRLNFYVCLAAIAFLFMSPNISQAKVQVDVVPGVDGFYRYQEWMPVTIFAKSDEQTLGDLRVKCWGRKPRRFSIPIELGQASSFSRTYYFQPGSGPTNGYCDYEFRVRGKKIGDGSFSGQNRLNNNDFLVAMVNPETSSLDFIGDFKFENPPPSNCPKCKDEFEISLANLDIPNQTDQWGETPFPKRWYGLAAVDVVVLDRVRAENFDSLSAIALKQWVKRGGNLVITGAAEMQTLAASPEFKELIPAEMVYEREGGIVSVDMGQLNLSPEDTEAETPVDELVPEPEPAQTIVQVVQVKPINGAIVVKEISGVPLVITVSYGMGEVTLVPMSFAQQSLIGWSDKKDFWKSIIGNQLPRDESGAFQRHNRDHYSYSGYSFLDLDEMKPPSASFMIFVVSLYILLISPVNYLVLKKRKMLNMSWLVIGVASLVFTAGNLTWAIAHKGFKPIIKTMSAIYMPANSTGDALVTTFASIYTTFSGEYDIQLNSLSSSPVFLQNPPAWSHLSSVDGSVMKDINANMWGTEILLVKDFMPLNELVSVELSEVDGVVQKLTIYNKSDYTLKHVAYFKSRKEKRIKDLAPHSSFTLDLSELDMKSMGVAAPQFNIKDKQTLDFLNAVGGVAKEFSVSGLPKTGVYALVEEPIYEVRIDRSFKKKGVTYMVWEL